jgi:hypothetical protein
MAPDFHILGMMLLFHVEDPHEGRPLSSVPKGLPTCKDQSIDDSLPWEVDNQPWELAQNN